MTAGACILRDRHHAAVDMMWHAGEHFLRRRTEAFDRPDLAHEIMIAADAARRDDHRAGLYLELPDDGAARLLATADGGRLEDFA